MKDITVSIHAIERFAERILNVDYEDSIQLSEAKRCQINDLIKQELLSEHPEAYEIGSGAYILADYNVKVSVIDYTVTTSIKLGEEQYARVGGGIIRSGKKVKKKRASQYTQQRHINKENHRAFFGSDD